MTPSILLLDCSSGLSEKLKRQGFEVASGSIGFCSSVRHLPCQIYEKDILIYNPSLFASNKDGYIAIGEIPDVTPEYSLAHLQNHILRGATFLTFVNHIAKDIWHQNKAYNWIPFMPEIEFTKDHQPIAIRVDTDYNLRFLAPIISQNNLKIPVLQKILPPAPRQGSHPIDVAPLFYNRNYETLGVLIRRGEGRLIILPECQSNEDIINIFLHRVMPKMYNLETQINLVDKFSSPEEITTREEIKKIEDNIKEFNEALGASKERLTLARLNKIQTIKKDETATLILNYYDLAIQQDDVALFYLYKVIEALEKKYGSEKGSKDILKCNAEWNLIGKLANVSYADIRHAPKPGEKIKEWGEEEIKACFNAAEKIINTYLLTLF
jgi:hypothetical protein